MLFDVVDYPPGGLPPDFPLQVAVDLPERILKLKGKAVFADFYDFQVIRPSFNMPFVVRDGVDEVGLQFLDGFDALYHHFKFDIHFLDFPLGIIDDLAGEELGVGDENDIIILVEQGNFGEVKVDDLALLIPDLDVVVNGKFPGETDDDAADDLRDIILGDDGNSGCDNAQGGEKGPEIYPPEAQQSHGGPAQQGQVIQVVQANDHVVGLAKGDMFSAAVQPRQYGNRHAGGEGKNKKADGNIGLMLVVPEIRQPIVMPGREEQGKHGDFDEEEDGIQFLGLHIQSKGIFVKKPKQDGEDFPWPANIV